MSTCQPSGLRFIRDNAIPVSTSVQLTVPSEDAAYTVPSLAGLNLQELICKGNNTVKTDQTCIENGSACMYAHITVCNRIYENK